MVVRKQICSFLEAVCLFSICPTNSQSVSFHNAAIGWALGAWYNDWSFHLCFGPFNTVAVSHELKECHLSSVPFFVHYFMRLRFMTEHRRMSSVLHLGPSIDRKHWLIWVSSAAPAAVWNTSLCPLLKDGITPPHHQWHWSERCWMLTPSCSKYLGLSAGKQQQITSVSILNIYLPSSLSLQDLFHPCQLSCSCPEFPLDVF